MRIHPDFRGRVSVGNSWMPLSTPHVELGAIGFNSHPISSVPMPTVSTNATDRAQPRGIRATPVEGRRSTLGRTVTTCPILDPTGKPFTMRPSTLRAMSGSEIGFVLFDLEGFSSNSAGWQVSKSWPGSQAMKKSGSVGWRVHGCVGSRRASARGRVLDRSRLDGSSRSRPSDSWRSSGTGRSARFGFRKSCRGSPVGTDRVSQRPPLPTLGAPGFPMADARHVRRPVPLLRAWARQARSGHLSGGGRPTSRTSGSSPLLGRRRPELGCSPIV